MEQGSEACVATEPSPSVKANPSSPTAAAFPAGTCSDLGETSTPSNEFIDPSTDQHSLPLPSLEQTQNGPSSPPIIHNLPEEILIDIFFLLINHASPGSPQERELERTVQSSYRQLFILLSVCSGWRRICLSRGTFWSLISSCNHWKSSESVLNLCLERMQDSNIHLDGELEDVPHHRLLEIISGYGPRIRTLNISGEYPEVLGSTVTSLLEHSKPGSVSSLCLRNDKTTIDSKSHHTWPFLFPLGSSEHTVLNGFTDSLSILRLSGFRLDWSQAGFSTLVELKIQRICFDGLSEISDLLNAIALAPKLNRLHLIDLRGHMDDIHTLQVDRPPNIPTFHPSLQFLCLKNIRWGLLILILRSIIPGSYRTMVGYSYQKEYLIRYTSDLTLLKESSVSNNIGTLMVSRDWVRRSDILRSLLKAMPTIKELCIAHCEFSKQTFQSLVRPSESSMDESEAEFPTIRSLRIMGSIFELEDLDGLKEVVTSHGIQELKLGGSIDKLKLDLGHTPALERSIRFEDPNDDEHTAPLVAWLRDTVPKFGLVRTFEGLPDFDFQSYHW